jgi:class 3 adenylate cyclase
MLQEEETPQEQRYDAGTLRKVTALAQQLQARNQETLSAAEIQNIGAEVGLEPRFIQEALAQVSRSSLKPKARSQLSAGMWGGIRKAWWAAGWGIPMMVLMAFPKNSDIGAGLFFLLIAAYFGIGILLGARAKAAATEQAGLPTDSQGISRSELLGALSSIRDAVASRPPATQHDAVLSVDVDGFTGFRSGTLPGAAAASFDGYRWWISEVVHKYGGEFQRGPMFETAGVFHDETAAVRAAHEIQDGIAAFNQERNRLPQPFKLRCAVAGGAGSEGSALQLAAEKLRNMAEPGDILVNTETAAEAVVELGGVCALPEEVNGERIFSWRAAHRG